MRNYFFWDGTLFIDLLSAVSLMIFYYLLLLLLLLKTNKPMPQALSLLFFRSFLILFSFSFFIFHPLHAIHKLLAYVFGIFTSTGSCSLSCHETSRLILQSKVCTCGFHATIHFSLEVDMVRLDVKQAV
ncbi:hypothetical protein VNO77_23949 [Canavalia gladiata]|uniref:Uncharacterized protein n=1 Tax=Canavalia gladiata TaxID=3824 RepID=A0AAN9L5A9_CANGL